MTDKQTRGRYTLLLISAIFFAPIFLAMYLYFSDNPWRPSESTQRGELLTPPIELPAEEMPAVGQNYKFREVWSLIVLAGEQCDALCMTTLENIRQIRLSLGPKMTRLQTVFLPASPAAAPDPAEFPKLIVAEPESAERVQLQVGEWKNGQIFLVDPLGNLMMSYAPGTDMADIRSDLKHLFKLSGIG